MDRPPADPAELLASWRESEKAEPAAGHLLKPLEVGGMRRRLDQLVAAGG